jgi:hypothetical protein
VCTDLADPSWFALPVQLLKLRLEDVQDSRCPANVQCIWAGQVTANISVYEGEPAGYPIVRGCSDTLGDRVQYTTAVHG